MISKWIINSSDIKQLELNAYDSYNPFDFYRDYFKNTFLDIRLKINVLYTLFYKYEPFFYEVNPILANKIRSLILNESFSDSEILTPINEYLEYTKTRSRLSLKEYFIKALKFFNQSDAFHSMNLDLVKETKKKKSFFKRRSNYKIKKDRISLILSRKRYTSEEIEKTKPKDFEEHLFYYLVSSYKKELDEINKHIESAVYDIKEYARDNRSKMKLRKAERALLLHFRKKYDKSFFPSSIKTKKKRKKRKGKASDYFLLPVEDIFSLLNSNETNNLNLSQKVLKCLHLFNRWNKNEFNFDYYSLIKSKETVNNFHSYSVYITTVWESLFKELFIVKLDFYNSHYKKLSTYMNRLVSYCNRQSNQMISSFSLYKRSQRYILLNNNSFYNNVIDLKNYLWFNNTYVLQSNFSFNLNNTSYMIYYELINNSIISLFSSIDLKVLRLVLSFLFKLTCSSFISLYSSESNKLFYSDLNTNHLFKSFFIPKDDTLIQRSKDFYISHSFNYNFVYYYYWKRQNILMTNDLTNSHIVLKTKWLTFFSRLYGLNRSFLDFFISYIGYNRNISILKIEKRFFYFFRWLLKTYIDFFTLAWYRLYLDQRNNLLPLLKKGIRFIFKYPCRGQRTRSNYRTVTKLPKVLGVKAFQQKLTSEFISTKYPNWTNLKTFYFHKI